MRFWEKLKGCFGGLRMTWLRVLIFAAVSGIYTGLVNSVPLFRDTSLTDVAVNPECWLLFGLLIAVNCTRWWEAALKCFVFFLVSQPLVYLVEVPFSDMGWALFGYYPRWLALTLLVPFLAVPAFLIRRKKWYGAVILIPPELFLGYMAVEYGRSAVYDFPRHLLSALFCAALAVLLPLLLLDAGKPRRWALAAAGTALAVCLFVGVMDRQSYAVEWYLPEGTWTVTVEHREIVKAEIRDDNLARLTGRRDGSTYVWFDNGAGERQERYVTVSGGRVWVSAFDPDVETGGGEGTETGALSERDTTTQ